MQENIHAVVDASWTKWAYHPQEKNKILKDNSSNAELEVLEKFIDKQGGTDADRLKNIWDSMELSLHTKVSLFNIVKSVLMI